MDKIAFNEIFVDNTKNAIKIPKEKYQQFGSLPVIDQGQQYIGGYVDGIIPYNLLPCIIFGDHTRIIKYVDFSFTIGADGVKLLNVVNPDFIPKYLYYHLLNSHIPNIGYNRHFKFIKELFFIKYDLPTQQKIVEELDCLSEAIEKKKQQLAELDNLIKSKFNEIFGDPIENEKKWLIKELNEITNVRDGTHDSPKYYNTGYPLVTSKNLVNGEIDFNSCQLICEEDFLHFNKRSFVDNGDILMPMIGTIGGAIIVKKDRDFAIKNVALIKFGKSNNVVNNVFILYILNSNSMNDYFNTIKKGGTQNFISLGLIRKIPTILPPIDLQNQFAEYVEQVDKTKTAIQQSIDELQTLFNERMQHYFGEEE